MTSVINWDDKSYHHYRQFLTSPGKTMISNVRCKMRSVGTPIQPKSKQFDEFQISKPETKRFANTLQTLIISLISEQFCLETPKTGGSKQNMLDWITKDVLQLDQELQLSTQHQGRKEVGAICQTVVDAGSGFLRNNYQALVLLGCWKSLSRINDASGFLPKDVISKSQVNSDLVKETLNSHANDIIIKSLREIQATSAINKEKCKDLQALLWFIQVKEVTELLLSQFQAIQIIICYIVTVRILVTETLFLHYKLQVAKLITNIKNTQLAVQQNQISMDEQGERIGDLGRGGDMGEYGNVLIPGEGDADMPEVPGFDEDYDNYDDEEFASRMQQGDGDEFHVVPGSPPRVPPFQQEDFPFGNIEDHYAEQFLDGEQLIVDYAEVNAIVAAIPNDPPQLLLIAPHLMEPFNFEWNNLDPAHAG